MAQCFARARAVVKCDAVVHGYRVRAGSMARAVWNARKVESQCDYAFGSLEALAASGRASAETALSLLASSVENINAGCLCHISEIADGDAPHAQKGCRAQAWSVSELLRVWLALTDGV